jgi:hypothetical protein
MMTSVSAVAITKRDGALITTQTPAQLRHDTGQQNLEDAFLALIEQQEQP